MTIPATPGPIVRDLNSGEVFASPEDYFAAHPELFDEDPDEASDPIHFVVDFELPELSLDLRERLALLLIRAASRIVRFAAVVSRLAAWLLK